MSNSEPPAKPPSPRGRGTGQNPSTRFSDQVSLELEPEFRGERVPTQVLVDSARSILVPNKSQDLDFELGLNPYRGCEHGCSYCYARTYHEFLGYSAGLDFETKILIKPEAAQMLRRELSKDSYRPQRISLSGVTDPYQPLEKEHRLTRACLEVLAEFRNPVGLITKNRLVTRDLDLLKELAGHQATRVWISLTSLDPEVIRCMEPRTSSPKARLEAVRALRDAGVPVGVLIAPLVPGLTDHELPSLLEAAAEAGAQAANTIVLRLPGAVEAIFLGWLEEHFPHRRKKVEARLRDLRGGELDDRRPGRRFRGQGVWAEQYRQIFRLHATRLGLTTKPPPLSTDAFRPPHGIQGKLF